MLVSDAGCSKLPDTLEIIFHLPYTVSKFNRVRQFRISIQHEEGPVTFLEVQFAFLRFFLDEFSFKFPSLL